MPPVVVGLVVWVLLVRSGPLEAWTLYIREPRWSLRSSSSPRLSLWALRQRPCRHSRRVLRICYSFSAPDGLRTMWILAREAKLALAATIMAAFGAIVSEVGASMIVGGNLERSTRVLTTAIVTETSRGEIERALVLGFILLGRTFIVSSR